MGHIRGCHLSASILSFDYSQIYILAYISSGQVEGLPFRLVRAFYYQVHTTTVLVVGLGLVKSVLPRKEL